MSTPYAASEAAAGAGSSPPADLTNQPNALQGSEAAQMHSHSAPGQPPGPGVNGDQVSSTPFQQGSTPSAAPPAPSFVYALGRIEPKLPTLSLEKEFAQVAGRSETSGLTDRQVLHSVLSDRGNRYIARQLCWILAVAGLETYVLLPRDTTDFDLLIEAVRPQPNQADLDVVIGMKGPLTPPQMCGGLVLPTVIFDQVYSFDRESLLSAIPRPESIGADSDEQFRVISEELLDRILQLADNAGATDEHRALNYLAVRYPAIYARLAEAHYAAMSLAGVDVRTSRLSGARKIVDVIFTFRSRQTDVAEQSFVRVDVTEEFPFLISKLAPYYEH